MQASSARTIRPLPAQRSEQRLQQPRTEFSQDQELVTDLGLRWVRQASPSGPAGVHKHQLAGRCQILLQQRDAARASVSCNL